MKRALYILISSLVAVVLLGLVARVTPTVLSVNDICDLAIQEHAQAESSSISNGATWWANNTAEVSITNHGSTVVNSRVVGSPLLWFGSLHDILGRKSCGARNMGLNFTAFRHLHQRQYYIYDLHRIRV